jgi:hypothetical protein
MVMSVTVEGVPVPRSSNQKPKRLVRGRRRTVLAKCIQHLKSCMNQDAKENTKASKRGYTPYLIFGFPGSASYKAAFNTLQNMQLALAETA